MAWANLVLGFIAIVDRSRNHFRFTAAAAAGAAAGIDRDTVAFGKIEQIFIAAIPDERASGFIELYFNGKKFFLVFGNRHGMNRSGTEGFIMDIFPVYAPLDKARNKRFHHRCRAADIELFLAVWQGTTQQIHIDIPMVLMVAAYYVTLERTAIDDNQMKMGVLPGQILQ